MTEPVQRRGEWWQQQPDGSWLKWNEDRDEWEPQNVPPPPPDTAGAPTVQGPDLLPTRSARAGVPDIVSQQPARPVQQTATLERAGLAISGALMIVAPFLPWTKGKTDPPPDALIGVTTYEYSGFDSFAGWLLLVAGFMVLAGLTTASLAFLRDLFDILEGLSVVGPVLGGFLGVFMVGVGYATLIDRPVASGSAFGLWVALIGSLGAIGFGLYARTRA